MSLLLALILLAQEPATAPAEQSRAITLPLVDLADDSARVLVVDREAGQYLGHVSTVLLEDGRTILAVYPKGHGRGAIVLKRSVDGGRTWSERLPTPASWATSLECPSIHRVSTAEGGQRLLLFSGLWPARLSSSEDGGATWSELAPIGDWGGIVVLGSLEAISERGLLGMFHDDGRFFTKAGARSETFTLYQTVSRDEGRTWETPRAIQSDSKVHLCEPGLVRSPDGKRLVALLRENRRARNSFALFSDDEGATWSEPRELPAALTGDRHTAKYLKDGRLFVSFRDMAHESPTRGDWVAWVGSFEDLAAGREGQLRLRLMDNLKGTDCAYPGVEVLADGTVVATTYGHWTADEQPWIACLRLDPRAWKTPPSAR
jgi:hypothetical protein